MFASIPNLLADQASAGLAQQVAPYVDDRPRPRRPFRLDELNSASCSGRFGVSDTFASALWVLDTLFNLAVRRCRRGQHPHAARAPYEPFTFTHRGSTWSAFVHPITTGC